MKRLLGNWDPRSGLKLHSSDGIVWSSKQRISLPKSKTILYKYVKIGDTIEWERIPGKENHSLILSPNKNLTHIRDEAGNIFLSQKSREPKSASRLRTQISTKFASNFNKKKKKVLRSLFEQDALNSDSPKSEDEKYSPKRIEIMPEDTVLIATWMLPFSLHRDENNNLILQKSKRILYPALYSIGEKKTIMRMKWIGCISCKAVESKEEQEEMRKYLLEYNCYPIFFSQDIIEKYCFYYENILTPIFHDFVSLNDNLNFGKPDLWKAYKYVNQIFGEQILKIFKEENLKPNNAMIWIQDANLLLTPNYIINSNNNVRIGLFMHSPFPSTEIFKVFPFRDEILKSMLSCDLIGFHLYEYGRHFQMSCQRCLGLNAESRRGDLAILYQGRNILLKIGHIGIESDKIKEITETPLFKEELENFKKLFHDKYVIASVDKMSALSGIKYKLKGFREFMRPAPGKKIVLVQYLTPVSIFQSIEKIREEIFKLKEEIEEEFGEGIIFCEEGPVSFEKRLALTCMSNTLFITSLRDGFCLLPFEYIILKKVMNLPPGTMVMSEFAGCSTALSGLIRVNPYNINDLATGLERAVNLSEGKKMQRFENDLHYIENHTTEGWARRFLQDLKGDASNETTVYLGMGFGLTRKIKTKKAFKMLNIGEVVKAYQDSVNRLIIFDNEGTLVPKAKHKRTEFIQGLSSKKTLGCLEAITQDDKNSVFVVSGRTKDLMHKWFSSISNLGLGCEYGFFYRWNSKHKTAQDFETLKKLVDWSWFDIVLEIFNMYHERTDGSYIERKESSLAWIYREADPEFGLWQAEELIEHLQEALKGKPIYIASGGGYVEVKPQGINKGTFVNLILKNVTNKKGPIDFIICIGDDTSDEAMFRQLTKNKDSFAEDYIKDAKIITCTVGRKPSRANYFVNDTSDVGELIENFRNASIKSKKNRSTNDLTKLVEGNNFKKSQPLHEVVIKKLNVLDSPLRPPKTKFIPDDYVPEGNISEFKLDEEPERFYDTHNSDE